MRMKSAWSLLVAMLLMIGLLTAQKPEAADSLLQAAIKKEVVDGNLAGAIEGYKKALAAAKGNRVVASMALVHMAGCYQKLGDAQARKLFEQVLREYADQKEAVTLARARLGGSHSGRPTNTLVWTGDNVDFGGTVSPDGRYISFVDWSNGDLALREVATGQVRRIVEAKNTRGPNWDAYAQESAISRDGKQVAFGWYTESAGRYELRIANLTGDPNPRRLYDDPQNDWLLPRDWSPDGKWIAVLIHLKDRTNRLGLVSVADGSLRVLRTGAWPGISRISFSPDGRHVGYDLPQSGGAMPRDVWVSATDGSGHTPVVVHRSHDFMVGWSPDGKRLLFGTDRGGSGALWSLLFADGKPQGEPAVIKEDLGLAESMGITRSGVLYYGAGSNVPWGTIQVASFDMNSGIISPTRDVSDRYQENNWAPWWSPDGQYLAYVSESGRRGSAALLVIRSAPTGRTVRALPFKMNAQLVGWATDSRSLQVVGQDAQGRIGAFRVDAETGEVGLIFESPIWTGESTAWSPDGRSMYYSRRISNSDEYALIRRDISSGGEKELMRRPFLGAILPSPDGKYLASSAADLSTKARLLLLIPVSGEEPLEVMRVQSNLPPSLLSSHLGQILIPVSWSPDSRSVIARKRPTADSDTEIWKVPIDGSGPRMLGSPLKGRVWAFRLSPDGRQVAFRIDDPGPRPRKQVWALENFLTAANAGK